MSVVILELRNVNSTLTTKDAKDRLTELTKQVFIKHDNIYIRVEQTQFREKSGVHL